MKTVIIQEYRDQGLFIDKNGELAGTFTNNGEMVSGALAQITVTPSSKNFGSKTLDTDTDQTVTVTNSGQAALRVGTLTGIGSWPSYPFGIVSDNISGKTFNSHGDSSIATIRFHPTYADSFLATLTIPNSDTTYAFDMTGVGVASTDLGNVEGIRNMSRVIDVDRREVFDRAPIPNSRF